jgi:DMSO/TMAO reductase YedYZ molybdopterin-dependent catalytic subunit
LTTGQNVVIPHVASERLDQLLAEPLLRDWRPEPAPMVRGLVACTGTEFCNLALIETKNRALAVAQTLEARLPGIKPLSIHWSGCPAACGNHHTADIGVQGKRIRRDGQVIEAVSIAVGGRSGPSAVGGQVIMDDVPCDENLPAVLEGVIRSLQIEVATPTLDLPLGAGVQPKLIREGVKYPKFADKFALLDFTAQPMPAISLFPLPATLNAPDVELSVVGLDCQPRNLRWDALAALPRYQMRQPLICQIFNWSEVVDWEGMRLAEVLELAGIDMHDEGYVGVYSRDGVYFEGLSADEARDPRVLLATGVNGSPLPVDHGGPLRLVVPFLQGYKSVKWVGAIRAFRHDPVGIKRLLAQSKIARLAPPWRDRFSIVPPVGRTGDPDPGALFDEPLSVDEIAPAPKIWTLSPPDTIA